MTSMMLMIVSAVVAADAPAKNSKDRFKVGQVIIVGNAKIPDAVIRRFLTFYPGGQANLEELKQVERRMGRSWLFRVNKEEGIRPTIVEIDGPPGSDYKDVLVTITESASAYRYFAFRQTLMSPADVLMDMWGELRMRLGR